MQASLQDFAANLDRTGFVAGMVTAFCECVDGECKRLALSPPFYNRAEAEALRPVIEEIIAEHGLVFYFEGNEDLPTEERPVLWVIAKYPEVLEAYRAVRQNGHNVCNGLEPFYEVLSYGTAFAANPPVSGMLRGGTSGCSFSHWVMQNPKQ